VIILSRCHCDDDTQAVSPSGYTENEQAEYMNIRMQHDIRMDKWIQDRKIVCLYLNRGPLRERIAAINYSHKTVGVHAAIEPHFNALVDADGEPVKSQRGFYAMCWRGSKYGLLLAQKMVERIGQIHPGPNLGVCEVDDDSRWIGHEKKEYDDAPSLAFVQNTRCPAVIVELGYYTNKEEGLWLEKLPHRYEVASAMARGIVDYLKEVIE